jgi:hypothetical protein
MNLPTPTSWNDLGKSQYFDLVAIADPSKSGSMHAMFEVILQGYGWSEGWKLITRIAANSRTISNHASQVGKDVATGESIFGIAIDTYAGDVIRQVGSRVRFITPTDYSAITGDGIALIQGAPHADLGKRFIEFVLSEAGQKIWYYKRGSPGGPTKFEIGKLPIIPELYDTGEPATVVPGSPFTFRNVFIFDAQKAAKRWNIVNDLFTAFILQVHDRLTASARAHPGTQPASVPLSDAEVATLSPDGAWGGDQALRSTMVQSWSTDARAQFPVQHGRLYRYRWVPSILVLVLLAATLTQRVLRRSRRR